MIHNCIKCSKEYETNDPDPYFCDPCLKIREEITKKLEKDFVPRPRTETMMERYDNAPKTHGFPNAKDFL